MDFKRQTGIFDPAKHSRRVSVVGAGGIGGATVLSLAKMGLRDIVVHDFDTVEKHNQPNQLYGPSYFGEDKVEALKHIVEDLSGVRITPFVEAFKQPDNTDTVLISAVDSMEARKDIFQKWRKSKIPWLVDGRIGGQNVRVYTASKWRYKDYERSIVDVRKVAPVPCTQAAIIDVMFAVSALVSRAVRLILTGKRPEKCVIYDHRNLVFMKDS